jgi:putative hemolysin
MRPLDAMIAVSIDSTFTELVSFINSEGYSRMPVYRTDLNSIEGVLYIKDLLPFLDEPAEFAWSRMLRPGFFVTENKKIDLLLRDFQEKRVHMAIVKNELGQTSGIITLEDLIREIIGELNTDNSEIPESGFRKLDENIFVFDGRTPVQEFFRVLDQEHPFFREPGEEESLEDFIIEFNDELPEVGDELYYEQYTFVIEAVEQKRIKRVRVNVHAQA